MPTAYVIQRRSDAWYWLGQNQWIDVAAEARVFDYLLDAEACGQLECPVPLAEWTVVKVEIPEDVVASESSRGH